MAVRVEVGDPGPLVDEPVGFRVAGLRPGQVVTVRVRWEESGVVLTSEGRYGAGGQGVVDPASQPSLGGTYLGTDAFGLWWSALPPDGDPPRPAGLDPIPTTLTVLEGAEEVASATIRRRRLGRGVEPVPVREGGLVGLFFRPSGPGPFPGAMVLGGSAGGLAGADLKAALLASHGIAALAVAYFGMEGRPPFLVGIALEDLRLGLSWLCRRPEVAGTTVAVVGGSRGGELALLLGATYPEVGAVVAGAPSGVVWGGVAPEGRPGGAAWTLGGRPLPAMPAWRPELQAEVYATEPVRLAPLFAEVLGEAEAVEQAGIPVEQTNGPILLVTGDDDAMWPSRRMAEMVERRAAARGFPHPVCHLHYADAGHLCASPPGIVLPPLITHPTDGRRYLFGGTPAGNAAAAAHSWRRTIELVRPSPRQ